MLMYQSVSDPSVITDKDEEQRIPRISKPNMKLPVDDIPVHHYQGPKHPDMPAAPVVNTDDQHHMQRCQTISLNRAHELRLSVPEICYF